MSDKIKNFFDSFMKILVFIVVAHGLVCISLSYVLAFFGDGTPSVGQTGSYKFDPGYKIGFVYKSNTHTDKKSNKEEKIGSKTYRNDDHSHLEHKIKTNNKTIEQDENLTEISKENMNAILEDNKIQETSYEKQLEKKKGKYYTFKRSLYK